MAACEKLTGAGHYRQSVAQERRRRGGRPLFRGGQGHISVTCACEVNLMGLPLSENGVFRGGEEYRYVTPTRARKFNWKRSWCDSPGRLCPS